MKGWKIINPFQIDETEINEPDSNENMTKVKITKSLITLGDVLAYQGEIDTDKVILGHSGIGIISEAGVNLFGMEKGNHVYIEPYKECGECYNCKSGKSSKCSDIEIAGEDYDGFLRDFASVESNRLFILPENVPDLDALFIEHISLAISVVDKLEIQKGDYVAIIGANNFGNILAQLLIYYQAVPIVLTNNEEDLQIAKDSGIYYVLGSEDNWVKEISSITSGRMTKSVVYISDCDIPAAKAFSLAAHNAKVAFTGIFNKNSTVSFNQAIRKQLNIQCISNGYGNTASSINLIANKAINLSKLKLDTSSYDKIPEVMKNLSETLKEKDKVYETIIDLI